VIVLGIDPGSQKTGWGVVEVVRRDLVARGWGVVRMPSTQPFYERLLKIHEELCKVIEHHHPDEAAAEGIFASGSVQNYQSALKLGQARGAALVALARAGLPLSEYPPAEVKKSLVGHGRAEKWQIQGMVQSVLKLDEKPAEDAADALAVAICHSFRVQLPQLRGLR